MTAKEFMIELQGYFGVNYNAYQGPYVRHWAETYQGDLRRMLDHVIRTREFLPKFAALEEIAREVDPNPPEDRNALPPPPRRDWRPLTDEEQAEVAKLMECIPGRIA